MPVSGRIEAMAMPLLIAIVAEASKRFPSEFSSKINSVAFCRDGRRYSAEQLIKFYNNIR
jgi:hypothetical protein